MAEPAFIRDEIMHPEEAIEGEVPPEEQVYEYNTRRTKIATKHQSNQQAISSSSSRTMLS